MEKLILGIDIGGTKTAVGVFDYDGELLAWDSSLNPQTDDADKVWRSMTDLIDKVTAPYMDSIVVCGVGTAGPMTAKGKTITPANIHAWVEFPLRAKLEEHIRKPAYVENDCKALALGEGWKGAAQNQNHYMSMVVSTGIGGGIVLDGRLLHGGEMQAGHIGHMVIEPNGPTCGCGNRGCLEALASGRNLEKIFGISPKDGTPEMIEYCADKVAQGIEIAAALLDIRHVTIGGSVALGFGDPFFSRVQETYDKISNLEFTRGLKIVPTGLGAQGGLISAARVGKLGYRGILWSR